MLVKKLWGTEETIVNNKDLNYCGKILTVGVFKSRSSIHYHLKKTETFLVISGALVLEVWPELSDKCIECAKNDSKYLSDFIKNVGPCVYNMHARDKITIKPKTPHRFSNFFDDWFGQKSCTASQFIEFSTYDDPEDSYRIINSEVCGTGSAYGCETIDTWIY